MACPAPAKTKSKVPNQEMAVNPHQKKRERNSAKKPKLNQKRNGRVVQMSAGWNVAFLGELV